MDSAVEIREIKLRIPATTEGFINVGWLLVENQFIKPGEPFSIRIRALHDENPHYDLAVNGDSEIKYSCRCPQVQCPIQLTIDIG